MDAPLFRRREVLASAAALGLVGLARPARAAEAFQPASGLVDGARKEGRMVLYSSSFTESIQVVINAFNQRFPFVRVELVRASGGQLFARVQAEAAAGKLVADIVDHSDRALMKRIEPLFQDYAPPNAQDYLQDVLVSPKLWPTIVSGWVIAHQTELAKHPPKTWWDLCKPEYGDAQIGQVIGPSGGTTWHRIMFERLVLGEDYWSRQAAVKPRLYPSGAPLSDALVRGEVSIAPLQASSIYPKKRDGAPVDWVFPPEGIPITPFATGIPKTAKNANAARLFLDWFLSPEGQRLSATQLSQFSALKNPPAYPAGFDPKASKLWVPDFKQESELHDRWVADWNRVYGYRQ
jgi:iron(III) transport system substrate-binding protein